MINRKTLYWGICLEKDSNIKDIEKEILVIHPHLILKKEIHSTLYFGKDKDEEFLPFENKKVKVFIEGYGLTADAVALKVERFLQENDVEDLLKSLEELSLKESSSKDLSKIPTYAKCQHITLALAPKIKPMDSYKSIETNYVPLKNPFTLEGFIKKY